MSNPIVVTQEQLTMAIRRRVSEWGDAPKEINSGYCADFASFVFDELGRPENLGWGNHYHLGSGHTWLILDNCHYDAECPDGVADWRDLPIWANERQTLPVVPSDD